MSPADRKRLILRFATLVEADRAGHHRDARGKPITDTAEIDLPETIDVLHWHGEAADKLNDGLTPSGPGIVSMVVQEPIVVACVLPWNFPLMMAARSSARSWPPATPVC